MKQDSNSNEAPLQRTGALAWTLHLKRLEKLAKDIVQQASFTPENGTADPRFISLLLLIRTLSHAKAIRSLTGKGMIVESRILARNCVENLIYIGALANEGAGFVEKMRDHDLKHKKMLGELLLKSVSEEEKGKLQYLRQTLRQLNEDWPDVQTMAPKNVAERGDVFLSYLFYSQLSADAAHPTTDSLSRYIVRLDESGGKIKWFGLSNPTKTNEDVNTIWHTSFALMGTCVGTVQMLKDSKFNGRLKKLEAEYHRNCAEFHPDVTGN